MEVKSVRDLSILVMTGYNNWKKLGDVNVTKDSHLTQFNYNTKCSFKPLVEWNDFERMSRGLIISDSGEIMAHPFERMENFDPHRHDQPVSYEVTVKMDGSLGIMFHNGKTLRIVTRESMDSDWGWWATNFLYANFDAYELERDKRVRHSTLLFEIIYPSNKVVLDYDSTEDIVLIGGRNNTHGSCLWNWDQLKEIAKKYNFTLVERVWKRATLQEVAKRAADLSSEHEGFVCRPTPERLESLEPLIKIKGDEYRELRKRINLLSSNKKVIDALADGSFADVVAKLPEPMQLGFRDLAKTYSIRKATILKKATQIFNQAPKDGDRKLFALWYQMNFPDWEKFGYSMLDGEDVNSLAWAVVKKEEEIEEGQIPF